MKDWFDSDMSSRNRHPASQASILDLSRPAHAASLAVDAGFEAGDRKNREKVLFDQGAALPDRPLTFRAKTLGDTVGPLDAEFIAADDMVGFETPLEGRERAITIRRALLSTIPLIAAAAALDLAEIGAEFVPGCAAREFPMEA